MAWLPTAWLDPAEPCWGLGCGEDGPVCFCSPCLPFWIGIALSLLPSQEGGECHSCHCEARASKALVPVPSSPKETRLAKRERVAPPPISLSAGTLKLFEASNIPSLVSRQMPLGWGGAPFSASVLVECQRPKLYAFPSWLKKQPSRGFCPCIIQEATKLETANSVGFPSQGGSLSQATIV